MTVTNTFKALGDWFNSKGNNKDLIDDRVKRGKMCVVNSVSLCNELSLGKYTLITLIVLYGAVFLSSVLFNSQAWSDIKKSEFERLQVVQLKYLKRSIKAPSSCPNAGTFLEFGILPIEGEIHTRQLSFLHHILLLEESDPVYRMYVELKSFPAERNWANDICQLFIKYDITCSEEEIKELSVDRWKSFVKNKVGQFWFNTLSQECANMKKTELLEYEAFECQSYLTDMSPLDAQVIFRARLSSISCKGNMPSSHRTNMMCRLCGDSDETQGHVLNCAKVRQEKECLDMSMVYDLANADPYNLKELCCRVRTFNDLIEQEC